VGGTPPKAVKEGQRMSGSRRKTAEKPAPKKKMAAPQSAQRLRLRGAFFKSQKTKQK